MTDQQRYSRRDLILNSLSLTAVALLPANMLAGGLTPTPYQTPGPFYPRRLPPDSDNNLVDVKGRSEPAKGQVTHIMGRVLDLAGEPVTNARIEIWQCDAYGRYHHSSDWGGRGDDNFQGFGHMSVTSDGGYHFRTIRPTVYPGRTPHIHFKVAGYGIEAFTTQMYVAGDPRNDHDAVLNAIHNPQARASLIVPLVSAPEVEPDALAGVFNIVLGLNPVL